jgi:hypothetical protein
MQRLLPVKKNFGFVSAIIDAFLLRYLLTHLRFGACFIAAKLTAERLTLVCWKQYSKVRASLNSGAAVLRPYEEDNLGNYGVGLFGVDAELFYGFSYDGGLDFTFLLQFVQRG